MKWFTFMMDTGIDVDVFKWIVGGLAIGTCGMVTWLMKQIISQYKCQVADLRTDLADANLLIRDLIGKLKR